MYRQDRKLAKRVHVYAGSSCLSFKQLLTLNQSYSCLPHAAEEQTGLGYIELGYLCFIVLLQPP